MIGLNVSFLEEELEIGDEDNSSIFMFIDSKEVETLAVEFKKHKDILKEIIAFDGFNSIKCEENILKPLRDIRGKLLI